MPRAAESRELAGSLAKPRSLAAADSLAAAENSGAVDSLAAAHIPAAVHIPAAERNPAEHNPAAVRNRAGLEAVAEPPAPVGTENSAEDRKPDFAQRPGWEENRDEEGSRDLELGLSRADMAALDRSCHRQQALRRGLDLPVPGNLRQAQIQVASEFGRAPG